jgi:hypothetical protein
LTHSWLALSIQHLINFQSYKLIPLGIMLDFTLLYLFLLNLSFHSFQCLIHQQINLFFQPIYLFLNAPC